MGIIAKLTSIQDTLPAILSGLLTSVEMDSSIQKPKNVIMELQQRPQAKQINMDALDAENNLDINVTN